jgi:glycosyltransferase involved in cell wall biosynthesis
MRVGIDLAALIAKPTGVDRCLMGLVFSLARIDQENHYTLFINFEDRDRFRRSSASGVGEGRLPPNFRVVPLSLRPRAARLLFQQVLQPAALQAFQFDVLHSPTFIMPLYRGSQRHLLTIHDMSSFLLPDYHPPSRRGRMYERAVARSIRRADLVSVPSPSVRQNILDLLPDVSPGHVRVIPFGIDESFRPRDEYAVKSVVARLGITQPYILYLGTLDPRKNLPRLLDSYQQLVARGDTPEHLVLAGQLGWSVNSLSTRLSAPEFRGRVHAVGYVDDSDLPPLYSGARLFVYPSLLEGFGFPPLEAMACGTPVVASLSSSLQDNLAGAAELVSPEDVAGLTNAMSRLLRDEQLRTRRIAHGLERATRFRWEACARQTLECYRELAARPQKGAKQPAKSSL